MKLPLIALATALAALGTLNATESPVAAQSLSARPVVIELFTSQGCSSCPPADALLERLAAEPGIVAITRPVTYWDQLGWKDTLASPANTDLQRAYGSRNLPGGGVYTPEVVVQGQYGAVGSDERRIRSLIAKTKESKGPTIDIAGQMLTISGGSGKAFVELVRLRPSVPVSVGSGENGGRKIRYVNVLQSQTIIGSWTGGTVRIALPKDALSTGHAAILLRDGKAGPILASRLL